MSGPAIRIVSILSLLTATSPRKVGLVEISDRLGIARSTCSLALAELCSRGYVIQEHKTFRYGIGIKPSFLPRSIHAAYCTPIYSYDLADEINCILNLPVSIVDLAKRSSVVSYSLDPVSSLASMGFRRPHLAPFGACFLTNSTQLEREKWVHSALKHESARSGRSLTSALHQRIRFTLEHGYEVIFQWEQDLLESMERYWGRWVGNLFEIDSRMNKYRREVLKSLPIKDSSINLESGGSAISRIVLPVGCNPNYSKTCVEIWLNGSEMKFGDIDSIVSTTRQILENHEKLNDLEDRHSGLDVDCIIKNQINLS